MRPLRSAAALLGGLLLTAALPAATATAANGTFIWIGPTGQAYSLQNPPDHKCYDMGQEASGAHNATKQPLVVYTQKKCQGTATRLAPGKAEPAGAHFNSLIFNPR